MGCCDFGRNRDAGSHAPETLEIVKTARILTENMNHEISVIHQNPVGGLVALSRDGLVAQQGELSADLVTDRVVLTGVGSRTNEEIVSKTGYFLNIEDLQIECFFRLSGAASGQKFGGKGC